MSDTFNLGGNSLNLGGSYSGNPIQVALVGDKTSYGSSGAIKIDHTIHGDANIPIKIDLNISKNSITEYTKSDVLKLQVLLDVIKTMNGVTEADVAHMMLLQQADVTEILMMAMKNIQAIVKRLT